jgi:hypothetical protein
MSRNGGILIWIWLGLLIYASRGLIADCLPHTSYLLRGVGPHFMYILRGLL